MAGAFLLSSRKEKRLAYGTKRRTPPPPVLSQIKYEQKVVKEVTPTIIVLPPFEYRVYGSIKSLGIDMYNGFIVVKQIVPDQNGSWNRYIAVAHVISVTVSASDQIDTIQVNVAVQAVHAILTQSNMLEYFVKEPTEIMHSVLLAPDANDGYLLEAYYYAHTEFSYASLESMETNTQYWWVPRCRTCYSRHWDSDPHDYRDDAYDDIQLLTSQLFSLRLAEDGSFIVESIHAYQ